MASGTWGGAVIAAPALLVMLMAWAALLFAGLGGSVGVASQSLASKLAASVQFLQRQSGTASASRTMRRDLPAVAGDQRCTTATVACSDRDNDVGPLALVSLRVANLVRATEPLHTNDGPHGLWRHLSPPSRAPPVLG